MLGFEGIPRTAIAVTPSDSAGVEFNALYVGVLSDVTLIDGGGNSSLWKTVPAGSYIVLTITKVMATGTTPGTNLLGLL